MADKTIRLQAADGSVIAIGYADRGDGTFARKVAVAATVAPTLTDKTQHVVAAGGTSIALDFVDQGNGTFARLATV